MIPILWMLPLLLTGKPSAASHAAPRVKTAKATSPSSHHTVTKKATEDDAWSAAKDDPAAKDTDSDDLTPTVVFHTPPKPQPKAATKDPANTPAPTDSSTSATTTTATTKSSKATHAKSDAAAKKAQQKEKQAQQRALKAQKQAYQREQRAYQAAVRRARRNRTLAITPWGTGYVPGRIVRVRRTPSWKSLQGQGYVIGGARVIPKTKKSRKKRVVPPAPKPAVSMGVNSTSVP